MILHLWATYSPVSPAYLATCQVIAWPFWPVMFLASGHLYFLFILIFIIQHTPVHSHACTAGQIQYLFTHVHKCSAFWWRSLL